MRASGQTTGENLLSPLKLDFLRGRISLSRPRRPVMSQADVALLRDAYRDFSSGDFPAASQVLAPDIEWVESGTGMPYSGTWHGPASVVNDVWTSFVQYWGGPGVVGMETDQFLDAGDHVVVTGRFTGKDSAGHALDAPCAHVWRMEGGFAVRFQNYTDWAV
jgi:ketosteroid isomerase-like protein